MGHSAEATVQAFLDDIVAHPHDPTPWLVFADWLEERDDPRGELVRLLRLCWDEPRKKVFKERHARLEELFAAGVRLPLPRYTNNLGMEFVWVPPGRFWMGGGDGKPGKKKVALAEPFWLGTYPVTQGQWQAVTGQRPCYFWRTGDGAEKVRDLADADLDQFPVESVSWNDVQEFLKELNRRENSDSGWTYRLPTEAEWEYALRSPVTCPADCAFSFYVGGQPADSLSSEQANFDGNYDPVKAAPEPHLKRPSKVGSYPPNRLGIYDLHGNVWEWTDTVRRVERVARGGCWHYAADACAAEYGSNTQPAEDSYGNIGFRLARVPARA